MRRGIMESIVEMKTCIFSLTRYGYSKQINDHIQEVEKKKCSFSQSNTRVKDIKKKLRFNLVCKFITI